MRTTATSVVSRLGLALLVGCGAPGCYSTTTEALVTVREPALVTARHHPQLRPGHFLPPGRGPATMRAVAGRYAELWLIRAKDGGIGASPVADPGPFLFVPPTPVVTAKGELLLDKHYVAAVEKVAESYRPEVPLIRAFYAEGLVRSRTETTEHSNGTVTVKTTRTTEITADNVVFETPRSNLLAIEKRTGPNRLQGGMYLGVAVLGIGGAGLIAGLAHARFPENRRESFNVAAAGMAVLSLPALILGTYMLTKPAKTEPLWTRRAGDAARRGQAGSASD